MRNKNMIEPQNPAIEQDCCYMMAFYLHNNIN